MHTPTADANRTTHGDARTAALAVAAARTTYRLSYLRPVTPAA